MSDLNYTMSEIFLTGYTVEVIVDITEISLRNLIGELKVNQFKYLSFPCIMKSMAFNQLTLL